MQGSLQPLGRNPLHEDMPALTSAAPSVPKAIRSKEYGRQPLPSTTISRLQLGQSLVELGVIFLWVIKDQQGNAFVG